MNDEAREVLVAAALRGHRQIRGTWHDRSALEGECGLGVLHLAMHRTRVEALLCRKDRCSGEYGRMSTRFGFDESDLGTREKITKMNDSGADFLTIARKVGTDP